MKSLKKVSSGIDALKRVRPFVPMHTAIKGLIEPHFDYFSAVCDGLNQQLIVRNFKNFKIVLSKLSLILRMIRVPDIFLTRLAGTIYRLEGLNKRLI